MTEARRLDLLRNYLSSGRKIATRLAKSGARVTELFPLDADRVSRLTDEEEERLDAFLHRFASLAATVQDHVGRALLIAEEENVSDASRKDQRLLLEKLGALDAGIAFGVIAHLRNRLVHTYPDDPYRQAEVLNQVHSKSADLISVFDGMADYAREKFGVDVVEA